MALKYVQSNTLYQAGNGNIIGATSIILTTLTDIYTNVLTMTSFGTKGYCTAEPDTTNEEAFTFTGITANTNGTYTLTGVSTALAQSPYTETSGMVRQHAGGTKVVITDNVAFWNTFGNKNNNEVLVGLWTAPTGGTGSQIATATDIANAVTGVSGTATNLVNGTVKLDVAAVSAPSPIAVGSNSPLIVPTGTSGGIIGFTSTTARSSSVLLTQHALIVGGGAGATPTPVASLGTITTVLHGNASGDPTFGAVSLAADVSGVLPVANGGTGSSTIPFSGLFKNGVTTKNAADASTTQNIPHGLGVIPKFIRITATGSSGANENTCSAFTVYNGTTQSSASLYGNSNSVASVATFTLSTTLASSGDQTGIVTFDATNIIITWTKTSGPTGTYNFVWEAYA